MSDAPVYAGLGIRALALIVDLLLASPLYIALRPFFEGAALDAVFALLVMAGYCWAFTSKWQATPGMRLMAFHITNADGSPLKLWQAMRWVALSTVTLMIALGALVYLEYRFDLRAVSEMMKQIENPARPTQMELLRIEQAMGMSIPEYTRLVMQAGAVSVLLMVAWVVSVAAGKQRAGVHNWLSGTRFVKGRL